ncbi:MAG TPA: aldo/keto reductase, partial [Anaerolineales bacterium]|nr:aldo/keto reductase [Anaerolineales bacterium]
LQMNARSEFLLGGDIPIFRLGFGAVQICGSGKDGWGAPKDRMNAVAVVRRAVDLGVNFIDTADSYGPGVSEEIIAEALYPYPSDVVIATKGGLVIQGPRQWVRNGRPSHLRQALEGSLRRLRLESIDLYQLHAVDTDVPIEESVEALADMQAEGKIHHIGLSNVDINQLRGAQSVAEIVSVQNEYNILKRASEAMVDLCQAEGLGFIPWFPLGEGGLTKLSSEVENIARAHNATPAQIALAWLLQHSPVMLPIPGTASIAHLEENVAALSVKLTPEEFEILDKLKS